jgi:ketosteroid isomerase-like protein
MTEREVEKVRGVYERWGEGEFRASLEVFHPDVVFVMGPGFPEAGEYHGVTEIEEYTRAFLEPWSRIAIEAEEIADAGDRVVAAVRQHGIGGGSGAPTEFRYFQAWTFRDGKAIRLENFRRREDAFRGAGV